MGYETIGASEEYCFKSRTRRASGRKEGVRERGAELCQDVAAAALAVRRTQGFVDIQAQIST
jgi:hypothetical protein